MHSVVRTLSRFASDAKGLTNIEFAMAAASLAIALSAGLLALGLGIESGQPLRTAAHEEVDPIMTGSIKESKPTPAAEARPSGCPDPQPVVILRR